MHAPSFRRLGVWWGAALAPLLAGAAQNAATVGLRLRHDSNLLLQDAASAPVSAPARAAAWGAQAGISSRTLWRPNDTLALEATYGSDAFLYAGHASENHVDYAAGLKVAQRSGPWNGEFRGNLLYVDGSREAPTFCGPGGAPAIGGEPVRARREQIVARASGRLTRTTEHGFARAVFHWLAQDFQTKQRNQPGYANYTDRGETVLGIDAGRRATEKFAWFAGLRVGRQTQADVLGVAHNYSNTLLRPVAGLEGALGRSVQLAVTAGPDWRHFGSSTRAGFVRRQQTGFGDATITWTPTARDTIACTAKRQLWLASGGRGIYLDTVIDGTWKHAVAPGWTVSAGANFHDGDFNPYYASPRHDHIFTATLALRHTLARGYQLDVELMHDWATSLVPATPAREYSRWVPSMGVSRTW